MPVSQYHGIAAIALEIQWLAPKSVVDLGVGFGKFGVLCREILDAWYGRCRQDQWEARIDGWEAFAGYSNPCWSVYSRFYQRDFSSVMHAGYDLVLMIDSLEHLAPEVGRPFLKQLVRDNKRVIVSVPNGPMAQGGIYGNPREAHLWTFSGLEEFAGYECKLLHQSVCTVVSLSGARP